jgi:hypothetical protein
MSNIVGKIVKSNGHTDYVCQVYAPGEFKPLPEPADYAYGTFVAIQLADGGPAAGQGRTTSALVGIVYNTLLVNPDFGNLGPRLSERTDLEVFSPDYLSETATLVGILAVGWLDEQGATHQGVPALAAAVNAPVARLDDCTVHEFHAGPDGRLALRYMPLLMQSGDPLLPPLMLNIVDRLAVLFPEQGPAVGRGTQ